MVMALSANNKMGFIDGTVKQRDEQDQKYQFWLRCNNMLFYWILNSVSREIAFSIIFIQIAKEMWADLKDRFRKGRTAMRDYYFCSITKV